MKESRRIELEQKLDEALARGDANAVDAVRRTIDRETLECTAHTAERLKRVESDVTEIKRIVTKMEQDESAMSNRKAGAKWAFGVVVSIVSVVGPVAAIKICKLIGILW